MLHPQGKNVTEPEFAQLAAGLASATWQLPDCEEYKGDLVQPQFSGTSGATYPAIPGAPQLMQALPPVAKTDPNSPATDTQWKKLASMAA